MICDALKPLPAVFIKSARSIRRTRYRKQRDDHESNPLRTQPVLHHRTNHSKVLLLGPLQSHLHCGQTIRNGRNCTTGRNAITSTESRSQTTFLGSEPQRRRNLKPTVSPNGFPVSRSNGLEHPIRLQPRSKVERSIRLESLHGSCHSQHRNKTASARLQYRPAWEAP